MLCSCVAPPPYSGPHEYVGNRLGVASGAAAGAIIGSHSGYGLEGALIGGIIGGIAGAAIGHVEDDRDADYYRPTRPAHRVYHYGYVDPDPPVIIERHYYRPSYRCYDD